MINPEEWEPLSDFIAHNGFLAAVILVNVGLTDKVRHCRELLIRTPTFGL
jgi:hypothetical protein